MALLMKMQDPRSHEPWWNKECEETFHQQCEAKVRFEKDPSKEASKAIKKLKTQMKRNILYAQQCYANKMRMAEKYSEEILRSEEHFRKQEEMNTREKKKKKKKAAKDPDGTESEGDNLDLTQEMYPLTHYVSDQEELINQMFSIIRGAKLEAMLPPLLKSIPVHELKNLCLHELRGMSKKRIICAINGQSMEGSSESEEEEEIEKETEICADAKQKESTPSKKRPADAERTNENSSNQQGLPAYLMKTIKVEAQEADSSGEKSSAGGKSVLELLELQMRARIIKTMLEKGDDGKALTEDAIAALMGTTTQTAQVPNVVSAVKVEKDPDVIEGKDGKEQSKGERSKEMERKKKSSDGKRHRDECSKHSSRSSHKKDHHRKKGSKRQRSCELRESDGENEKKGRRDRSSEKRSQKKKKITRREFEERMKRAKKNRTYRKRKSSEDEEKANALKEKESDKVEQPETEGKAKEENVENNGKKSEEGEVVSEKEEGEAVSEKEEGEAVSEKEEGEWDSNEEEEGACSPSDISSASYYSSSRSYTSRSRSRSYSRSWSRSPIRKKGRGRSKTKSRSRSRSNERRKRDVGVGGGVRWPKKRARDHGGTSSGNVKMSTGIVSLPSSGNQKPQKEEEDNWGQSCDIEFVDSEEDFDDNSADAAKNASLNSKKPLPLKGQNCDRASISFSLQKKNVPSITQNIDLDDLPMKSSSLSINKDRKISELDVINQKSEAQQSEEIIDLDSPKMISDEILISSDSEHELKDPVKAKSVRVEKRERELIRSLKESESIARKEIPVTSKTCNVVNTSNVTVSSGIKATSQETDLKGNDELVSKLNDDEKNQFENNTQPNQTCTDEGDNDELHKQGEGTDVNEGVDTDVNEGVQIDIDSESGRVEESPEKSNMQESIVTVEKGDQNEDEQTEYVNTHEKSVEIHRNDNKEDIDDQEYIDVETLDTTDESMDNSAQRTELPFDTRKEEMRETSVPREDLQGNAEANVAVASLHKSDVEIGVTECRSQEIPSSVDEAKENQIKIDDQSCLVYNEIDLTEEVTNDKKSDICEPGDTSDRLRQDRLFSVKEWSPKTANPKVILEHLQESYSEDHESTIQESNDEDQGKLVAEGNMQNVTPDYNQDLSQEGKEACEKSAVHKETYVEGEPEDHQQEAVQGEEGNDIIISEVELEKTKDNDNSKKQTSTDDFYRGADELTFSDDDAGNCNKDAENTQNKREVEPIRINTGLIRRRVTRSRKMEMAAPDKSWTKKGKKKRDKPKDLLEMEGIGLLRKTLAESAQSPSSKEGDEEPQKLQDLSEGKEVGDQANDEDTCTSWGISSVSSREETPIDSRVQSPKGNTPQTLDTSPISGNDETSELPDVGVGQKKTAQETEIIGVIEASSNPNVNQMDDIDLGGSSWSMRWLQSEKVQKVVSSSKMLSRVRKKIQKKDKATKVVTTTENLVILPKKISETGVPIIGSIEEYERLFGMKAKKQPDEAITTPKESPQANITSGEPSEPPPSVSTSETQQSDVKRTSFGSDDEGEDSEEEALWSKILGK